jgi:hypothetical protein
MAIWIQAGLRDLATGGARPWSPRLRRVMVVAGAWLVLLPCLTACRPPQPSAASWRTSTQTTVGDTLSDVATARLTLEQERQGSRFVGHYAQVVLTYSEEAAGSSAEKVSSQQPPPSERARWDRVVRELEDAAGLVTDTRVAVVANDTASYDELLRRLRATAKQLSNLENQLKSPAGVGQ